MTIPVRRRALLIHIEHYADSRLPPLPSARSAAEQLTAALRESAAAAPGDFGPGGAGPAGIEITVRADLTFGAMRATLARFCADREADEFALVHLACRSALTDGGELVLAGTDTDPGRLTATGTTAGFLAGCLQDCWAEQKVALLDCPDRSGRRPRPPEAAGVHLLLSDPTEESPVFTEAIAGALRAGAARHRLVTTDDLFDAADARLRGLHPPRRATSSAVRVDGRVPVAAPALARSAPPAPEPTTGRPAGPDPAGTAPTPPALPVTPAQPARPGPRRRPSPAPRPPGWAELLAYYRDTVREGVGPLPLLDPNGSAHLVLGGRERVLLDELDDDGTVPLPAGAARLLGPAPGAPGRPVRTGPAAAPATDRTLWVGWPLVVLHGEPGAAEWPGPLCAPLLVRRVEPVGPAVDEQPDRQPGGTGGAPEQAPTRLRPVGRAVPHPGLVRLLLGAEEAEALLAAWVPGWHRGEADRIVAAADQLLRDELGLRALDRLTPELLDTRLNTRSPLDGARNLAVLCTAGPCPATAALLADLDAVAADRPRIGDSALAGLLPGTPPRPPDRAVAAVTPRALTASQRVVLDAAMTHRLTAVGGPPGTGKTRLVVDAVATAVAAGQSVLVAARSERAVAEIVRRCRLVLPGLLVPFGPPGTPRPPDGGDGRDGGPAGVDPGDGGPAALVELLRRPAERRDAPTRDLGFRYAEHLVRSAEAGLRAVAEREAELLAMGRARTAAQARLGTTVEALVARLGPGWGGRAAELAGTRLLGEHRRSRFLAEAGLVAGTVATADTCHALAELDDIDRRWLAAGEAARAAVPDGALRARLATAQRRLEDASVELLAARVREGVDRGRSALAELRSTADRAAFQHALRHLRGWAVTTVGAGALPPRAGLFDLVVIDEAQHCPLPDAVPLLFRARRALVVGDPGQPPPGGVPGGADPVLRERHRIARDWLARHRLSPVRHSLLAAAGRAADVTATFDEHYRSHPAIAALAADRGPLRELHVLTDIGDGPVPAGPAVLWREVAGRAERGSTRTSWRNHPEADEAARCARRLRERLPAPATVGVITPFRAQARELAVRLAGLDRVRVGTPEDFRGQEHDAVVLSLVADGADHRFDRAQRQPAQWALALSRARYLLVVVGDGGVWASRGGLGGALLAAAHAPAPVLGPGGDDLADRLEGALSSVPGVRTEVAVRGHPADAVLGDGGHHRPVLIDRGADADTDPGVHLARMLRLTGVLGDAAIRLPGWILHDSADAARTHMAG